MATRALIMAGGRGERMKASGHSRSKPLVDAAGATLLERNVFRLLACGIDDVIVAVGADATDIASFADDRVRDLVEASGGAYERFIETQPLGNMGAAAAFRDAESLLVVYADNITAVALDTMLTHHRSTGVDLTFATHTHTYQLPFGRLGIEGDRVTGYVEKPVQASSISSGISILGNGALDALAARTGNPPVSAAGMVDLFHAVKAGGGTVGSFAHASAWVDVNEASALPAAESMIRDDPAVFEQWLQGDPDAIDVSIDTVPESGAADRAVVIDDVVDGAAARFRVGTDPRGKAAPQTVANRARFHL